MIYADHAATTPLSSAAFEAMLPFLRNEFGNPSSVYGSGQKVRNAIETARENIAEMIGAEPDEVFFTSGGTEADNQALTGIARRFYGERCHIAVSNIEHHAILKTCEMLKKTGSTDISLVHADSFGKVSAEAVQRALRPDTKLVSVMTANNEIGTIEPIAEITSLVRAHGALMHTDAVQAVGHISVDVKETGVDMLSASAHKFYGPKGTGFLYVRRGTKIEPLLCGGGQENAMRSGTENAAGIIGMAAALRECVQRMQKDAQHCECLRERLINGLRARNIQHRINGSEEHIPGLVSISLKGGGAGAMVQRLDLRGIAVSSGSACTAKSTEVSHVLKALGIPEEYIDGTLRITFGRSSSPEDADRIASAIAEICMI